MGRVLRQCPSSQLNGIIAHDHLQQVTAQLVCCLAFAIDETVLHVVVSAPNYALACIHVIEASMIKVVS